MKANYGLGTAITMIIGIVIGSGIFFKSDNVLAFTGGSVPLGILVFCIGAFGIIFGCLTLSELSMRTEKNGGVVGYYEDFISKKLATAFGWFQTFVYFPTLTVIISWVAGIYTCLLFGIENTLETQILFSICYTALFYAINIVSVKLGGYFQNLSTVIKLIPLLGIAIIGLFWGQPNPSLADGVELVAKSDVGFGWLAALVPIAFSFDGWVVATSITNEVKNPKKNMVIALVAGPLIVLFVYVLYFTGINNMLGSEYIMSTGDGSVDKVGEILLGVNGAKIILTFVLISILGVLNGLILGNLRMPQALASKNMLPGSEKIKEINSKIKLSIRSCIISFVAAFAWLIVHYITQKTDVLAGGDISEISIVFSYACYIILYIRVMVLKKNGEIKSVFKGIISPIFAIIGACIIFFGGFITNPIYVTFFVLFCLLVGIVGYMYNHKKDI